MLLYLSKASICNGSDLYHRLELGPGLKQKDPTVQCSEADNCTPLRARQVSPTPIEQLLAHNHIIKGCPWTIAIKLV